MRECMWSAAEHRVSRAFRGGAVFPTLSSARPAATRRARGRIFKGLPATRACADLGLHRRRRRDGVRRRVGGCELAFLWTSEKKMRYGNEIR